MPPEHERQRESWDAIADGRPERVRTNTDQPRIHVADPPSAGRRDCPREWLRAPPFIIFDCLKAAVP